MIIVYKFKRRKKNIYKYIHSTRRRIQENHSIFIIIIFKENYRDKDWKKAYVVLKTPVPEFF